VATRLIWIKISEIGVRSPGRIRQIINAHRLCLTRLPCGKMPGSVSLNLEGGGTCWWRFWPMTAKAASGACRQDFGLSHA
jgi:hypothetical protein